MAEKAKTSKKTASKSTASKKSLSESSTVEPQKEKISVKNGKVIALAAVIIVLIVLVLYLFKGVFVAATVNGEPITRIAVVKALEKQSGTMVLENMITKKLILQEAKNRNINVSQADIDAEIKKISDSLKKQGTTLEKAMEAQGMAKAELNDEIKVQIALRKMTESDIKVSDKEIQDFITANESQFAEGSTDAQKKVLALSQLKQQKASEKSQQLITDLQKKAKIMHFAGY